jgi:hypothetical protein
MLVARLNPFYSSPTYKNYRQMPTTFSPDGGSCFDAATVLAAPVLSKSGSSTSWFQVPSSISRAMQAVRNLVASDNGRSWGPQDCRGRHADAGQSLLHCKAY